jgi:hypothetical protein
MITNKSFYPLETKIIEMGFSHHYAVVMKVLVNYPSRSNFIAKKRVSPLNGINFFNCYLASESWNDIYLQT